MERQGKAKKLEGEETVPMGAQTHATSGSTVVEIEEKTLDHSGTAEEPKEEEGSCSTWLGDMEMAWWKQHCMYQVPEFIKKMTNRDAYQPQLVSLGPLHHGEAHLAPMEEHKRRAVLHLVNWAGKPLWEFVAALEEVSDELHTAYNGLDLDCRWRGPNTSRFVEMLITDGCFLLEVIRTDESMHGEKIVNDYATNDPVFGVRRFGLLLPILRNDLVAMENQIPLLVLQRLLAVQHGTSLQAQSPREINYKVAFLLDGASFEECVMDKLGLHFLDIYHKSFCGKSPLEVPEKNWPHMPCAVELSEAAFLFKLIDSSSIHVVDFKDGVLSMPLVMVRDSTETIYLNLMAFEWLHPDAKDDVACFISFVGGNIESERDVALLRSEGVLINMIGKTSWRCSTPSAN